MQALKADTVAMLDELNRLANVRTWASGGPARIDEITTLLQRIADAGEPLAIRQVISLALDSRREIAEAAGRCVKQLRERVHARDLNTRYRANTAPARHVSPEWLRARSSDPELRDLCRWFGGGVPATARERLDQTSP